MFTGQSHVIAQLNFILPALRELGSGSFLFRGPSGYGKTELAMRVANYFADTRYIFRDGSTLDFESDKRVHLYDEIHQCPRFEYWYPIMDSNRHILIYTTNADSVLPEAFVRRCYDYIFTDYTVNELREIVRMKSALEIPNSHLDYVIESNSRNPALVLSMIKRLVLWEERNPSIRSMSYEEFVDMVERIFGVVEGLNPLQQRYIEVLQRFGGTSSITNITNALHVDRGTITREVEPALMSRGKIQITSRGRSLV